MSSSNDTGTTPSENSGNAHRPILLGLLLIATCAAVWFALNWRENLEEARALREELNLTKLELKDARQNLEAQRVINRKQAQMLKEALEAPPAKTP